MGNLSFPLSGSGSLPAGGATNQYLAKNSSTDGDVSWVGPPTVIAPGTGISIDTTTTPGSSILNNSIDQSTWAARGTGAFDGQLKFIVDSTASTIFQYGPPHGFLVRWNAASSTWKLVHVTEFKNDTQVNGTLTTNEQVITSVTVPAGLLQSCRTMIIRLLYAKSGTTDAESNAYTYIGTLGTLSDQKIQPFSSGQMSAANRSGFKEAWLSILNTTTVRVTASQTGILGWQNTSSGTYPRDITVADMSANTLIISAAYKSGGTTDTVGVGQFYIELRP